MGSANLNSGCEVTRSIHVYHPRFLHLDQISMLQGFSNKLPQRFKIFKVLLWPQILSKPFKTNCRQLFKNKAPWNERRRRLWAPQHSGRDLLKREWTLPLQPDCLAASAADQSLTTEQPEHRVSGRGHGCGRGRGRGSGSGGDHLGLTRNPF